jgi:hypothetical protein
MLSAHFFWRQLTSFEKPTIVLKNLLEMISLYSKFFKGFLSHSKIDLFKEKFWQLYNFLRKKLFEIFLLHSACEVIHH